MADFFVEAFFAALFLPPAFLADLLATFGAAALAGEAEAPAWAAFGFLMVLLFGALLAVFALLAFPVLFTATLAINHHQHLFNQDLWYPTPSSPGWLEETSSISHSKERTSLLRVRTSSTHLEKVWENFSWREPYHYIHKFNN